MLNHLIYMLDPDADGVYVPSLPPWFQLDQRSGGLQCRRMGLAGFFAS
jgi:hypothetical protein